MALGVVEGIMDPVVVTRSVDQGVADAFHVGVEGFHFLTDRGYGRLQYAKLLLGFVLEQLIQAGDRFADLLVDGGDASPVALIEGLEGVHHLGGDV